MGQNYYLILVERSLNVTAKNISEIRYITDLHIKKKRKAIKIFKTEPIRRNNKNFKKENLN